MPSVLIGRTRCPECGFDAAHVKRSEKTTYRYCPEHDCGAQYFPRGQVATDRLVASMRPLDTGTAPPPVEVKNTLPPPPAPSAAPATGTAPPADQVTPPPAPPPVPERKRLPSFFR